MKRFTFLLLSTLLILCSSCSTSLKNILYGNFKSVETITVENVDREFIVQIPHDYDAATNYPVVFAFHGSNQYAERAWDKWLWKEKGQTNKFITIYPQSLVYSYTDQITGLVKTETKWLDGTIETLLIPGQTAKDDVLFVREILTHLRSNYSIDDDKLYATGFSNGGNFTWRLAMEANDEFSGFAPFAGRLALPNPTPASLPTVFLGIGNQDAFVVALNGGPVVMNASDIFDFIDPFNVDVYPALEVTDTYDVELSTAAVVTLKWDDATGSGNNYLRFSMLEGTTHVYPFGTNNPHGLKAADVYWDFFESLP